MDITHRQPTTTAYCLAAERGANNQGDKFSECDDYQHGIEAVGRLQLKGGCAGK
jgi:hypothetical protein